MSTRFDLEQAIMDCWQVSDDLTVVIEHVLESRPSADDIVNLLIGLRDLHSLKCQKAERILEELIAQRDLV